MLPLFSCNLGLVCKKMKAKLKKKKNVCARFSPPYIEFTQETAWKLGH